PRRNALKQPLHHSQLPVLPPYRLNHLTTNNIYRPQYRNSTTQRTESSSAPQREFSPLSKREFLPLKDLIHLAPLSSCPGSYEAQEERLC
ncbi:hypothetical protein BaRGS_00015136, partial [Batillaria attramentaria]